MYRLDAIPGHRRIAGSLLRASVGALASITFVPTVFALPLFPTAASVQLNGDAQFNGQDLVLTGGASELSSAWYQTPLSLTEAFRVSFSYRADVPFVSSGAGDGFGLVLQAAPTGLATLGQPGAPGNGYGGIANSLGLIVDIYDETLRLMQNGGNHALPNRTDWNTRDANGVWEHGVPGYPLPVGVDPDLTPPVCGIDPLHPLNNYCTVGGIVITDPGAVARHWKVGCC